MQLIEIERHTRIVEKCKELMDLCDVNEFDGGVKSILEDSESNLKYYRHNTLKITNITPIENGYWTAFVKNVIDRRFVRDNGVFYSDSYDAKKLYDQLFNESGFKIKLPDDLKNSYLILRRDGSLNYRNSNYNSWLLAKSVRDNIALKICEIFQNNLKNSKYDTSK